jgi:hypothetical protein
MHESRPGIKPRPLKMRPSIHFWLTVYDQRVQQLANAPPMWDRSAVHARWQMKDGKTWRSFLVRRLASHPGWLFIPRLFVTGIQAEFETRATGNLNKPPHPPNMAASSPTPSSIFLIFRTP